MASGLLLLVAAAGAAASANQFPTVKNPPSWRWDTLGAMSFAHTGQAQPYSPADLALLGRYPIVQFDKKVRVRDQRLTCHSVESLARVQRALSVKTGGGR